MPAPRKYPEELRERAIRLVRDRIADEPGLLWFPPDRGGLRASGYAASGTDAAVDCS